MLTNNFKVIQGNVNDRATDKHRSVQQTTMYFEQALSNLQQAGYSCGLFTLLAILTAMFHYYFMNVYVKYGTDKNCMFPESFKC